MTNKICGIYLISNAAGDKYVGQSINIHGRWGRHNKRRPTPEWSYEVLCECKPEDLDYSEIKCIEYFGSYWSNPGGLNKTLGGHGFSGPHSAETKKKQSDAQKGKTFSAETRAKMSNAQKGKPSPHKGRCTSPETKKKQSEAWKNRAPMSAETKRKMSETRRLNREKKKCLK